MVIEQGIIAHEISKQTERLLPGHKILLGGPAGLLNVNCTRDKPSLQKKVKFDEQLAQQMFAEWFSIYSLLAHLVGKDNVVVADTDAAVERNNKGFFVNRGSTNLLNGLNFNTAGAPYLSEDFLCWPRDAYTLLDNKILANIYAWGVTPPKNVKLSGLGEQGKVLIKDKAILVAPDIWATSQNEISELKQSKFKVGCLPCIDTTKQNYKLVDMHIDGHSALIKDKNGDLVLLVANSYFYQRKGTGELIMQAANMVEAKVVVVDDSRLPPLALNLIQFEDGSIAFTNSDAPDLEYTLASLVGDDKIFKTAIPITTLPSRALGGMRCLTNILPPSLNILLEKQFD